MSTSSHVKDLMPERLVPPTFGLSEVRADPTWEKGFAYWLKETRSLQQLHELFATYREGEDSLSHLLRRVLMRAMCRSVGEGLQVGPGVVLKHPETMEFGNSVSLGAQVMIQGRFDGVCHMGNHVWIGPQAYLDARNIVIEDYVGWGPGARVLGSVHTGEPVEAPLIQTGLIIKPVLIGYGADIGVNAVIMPGVTIGKGAIIGSGAVVLHDVPEYSIAAGVPARILRSREKE
jgi:acetyltransferase-like isoleucine patch superfamily enzyme